MGFWIIRLTLLLLGAIIGIVLLASVFLRKLKDEALRPLRAIEDRLKDRAALKAVERDAKRQAST